ncbi:MAG: HD domain-containing protein, partial [Acidimicrobiales bacterium]
MNRAPGDEAGPEHGPATDGERPPEEALSGVAVENPARAMVPPPTESVDGIIAILEKHRPDQDYSIVRRAHSLAMKAHHGQRRDSGEAYITHPVAVATIVAELGLDAISASAALLHDAVEDT